MRIIIISAVMLFTALCVNAQQVWNFSDLGAQSINKITKIDNLTIGGTSLKPVVIDENNKKIDSFSFTHRLKFPGPGSSQGRYVVVRVNGSCKLTVYGMASNNRDGVRHLVIAKDGLKSIVNSNFLANDGHHIGKDTFNYSGGPANLFIYCAETGFNLYGIVVD